MLTDKQIQNAKPKKKTYRLYDTLGLYLEVTIKGSKLWRCKYRFQSKEKRLSFGIYPAVGLKDARVKRDEARELLSQGIDPSQVKKDAKLQSKLSSENTFEAIALEWWQKKSTTWAKSTSGRNLSRLKRDIFPYLGQRPIAEIKAPELLAVLRKVEERDAVETAHRELSLCGQIFRYAIATAKAERDISADLKGALSPAKRGHFSATVEPEKVGQILRQIEAYQGTLTVQCALKLAPLIFVRPGELRTARWNDIDLNAGEWRFQASKTRIDHIVPLSRQAIAILKEISPITRGGEYVFPGYRERNRPMSDNALLTAFKAMGIPKDKMSVHGFRAIARTLLDEALKYRVELIEMQLAHGVKDVHGRAYNRTKFLDERKAMMQRWADYLDELKEGGKNEC